MKRSRTRPPAGAGQAPEHTPTPERYVIDTNVFVSFLLLYGSVPGQAVTKGWRTGVPLRSDSTLLELARVLKRNAPSLTAT